MNDNINRSNANKIRLGINGFGRIGRCIARIATTNSEFEIAAVNELNDDVENAVYLYNYDSTYGRAQSLADLSKNGNRVRFDDREAQFYCYQKCDDVPWQDTTVDIVIDATGIAENVQGCRSLVNSEKARKAIITHSPESGVDRYIVMGVNCDDYNPQRDHVVSTTICDTNAIAHVLKALDDHFGIVNGFVTTLHPWLSYQNLVDGPVAWQSSPGAYWKDFSLGRSSIGALIPKNTTAVSCLRPVLPDIEPRLNGFSYRTPTDVVCSADLSITLESTVELEQLQAFLADRFSGSPYCAINHGPLVSVDFKGQPYSAVLDARWLQILNHKLVKIVLWYDNEWGYSSRVLDLARLMAQYW
ncbi:MAG: glyceraldehyde 3-phosphate dehydrogenase NAD-binding domain-containing protein [Pseudomonadales bacterium]